MARLLDEFFNKNPIITKTIGRFIFRGLKPFSRLSIIIGNAHALPAPASRGFNHHGIADFLGDFDGLVRVFDQAHMARDTGHACVLGQFLGGDFITHRGNGFGVGANESHFGLFEFFGKVRIF